MTDDTNNGNGDPSNAVDTGTPVVPGTENLDADAQPESEVDVAKLQASNKRLYERAKKAEGDLKVLKQTGTPPAPKPQVAPQPQASSTVDVDERILKSQGMAPELLKELKDIAKLRGVGLIDAQSDSLFVAVKKEFDVAAKSKAASVGASRGSGGVPVTKTVTTPNLTREEHMKLVKG